MKPAIPLAHLVSYLGLVLAVLVAPNAFAADPEAPAELTITTTVAAPDPQPFGLNNLVGPKGFNNVNRDPTVGAMEPQYFRAKFLVTDVGKPSFRTSRLHFLVISRAAFFPTDNGLPR